MNNKTELIHDTDTKNSSIEQKNNFCSILPPIVKTSTVSFPNLQSFMNHPKGFVPYGRYGIEPERTLLKTLNKLENSKHSIIFPSGVSAIAQTIVTTLKSGEHILIADNVYHNTRMIAESHLLKNNIEHDFFDPLCVEDLIKKTKPNTKLIFLESPGSGTFEVSDTENIVKFAKQNNILTAIDNTWSAGVYFKPLNYGIDISIQSATKYICGHSDTLMGVVFTNCDIIHKKLLYTNKQFGIHVSPDAAQNALKGLKTLMTRIERHNKSAIKIANFLTQFDIIDDVIHPCMANFPNKDIFDKNFTGSTGLFAFTISKDISIERLANFFDSLELFTIGYSWGGFESLAILSSHEMVRSCNSIYNEKHIIRLHIGLECTKDLMNDLKHALMKI